MVVIATGVSLRTGVGPGLGGPGGWIVSGLVVLALAALGSWAARRRR